LGNWFRCSSISLVIFYYNDIIIILLITLIHTLHRSLNPKQLSNKQSLAYPIVLKVGCIFMHPTLLF
jgi:hypothetical protein